VAQERLSMRKIKEVLRLYFEGRINQSKIACIVKASRSTVQQYIMRFTASGLTWPLVQEIGEEDLERRLFPDRQTHTSRPAPDYDHLLQEIRRPDATLSVLWEEYKQQHPGGYQYSHFCDLFNAYRSKVSYSMRQEHKAGEKTFIDFGDSPIKVIDPKTGIETGTKIFVSVWGASNYMFARSCYDEQLPTWIRLNIEALKYFGCCPKAMVPDNLKSAVSRACRYEPDINPTYAEFAEHYGTVIFPARPYRPKDKSKAENGVKLARRWILFRLRNRMFYSLSELNQAIDALLEEFNDRIMKKFKKSRSDLFEQLDKPHALALPESHYEFAEWKRAKVQFNYHISHEGHDYSVPYTFISQEVDIKTTCNMVEVYCKGKRICSHRRSYKAGYTTVPEHMPISHQKYLEWTPDRILRYAEKYGASVKELIEKIMGSRRFPEQAYKSCIGIIRLENKYTAERLNLACKRALDYRAYSYSSVVKILDKNLDKQITTIHAIPSVVGHENVRGSDYYLENTEENNYVANYN